MFKDMVHYHAGEAPHLVNDQEKGLTASSHNPFCTRIWMEGFR